ncbi:DEAD/DEAH box helicase [candidate division KSB1 bacterium]|nr:DEAD/DEAH box helicase [candidate division KSB1 bacterium]
MDPMVDPIVALINQNQLQVVARHHLAPRAVQYQSIPARLHPRVRQVLTAQFPAGLYTHQSQAIELILDGKDLCLATPTASGKSLVFMTSAAHLLLQHANARVLALYPAKALIQDQLNKWHKMLAPLDFQPGYIDGSIPVNARPAILEKHRLLLMTPDVMHAWIMSHLNLPEVKTFVENLEYLILDEIHVYDGIFGTNMAYLIRRIQAVTSLKQIISSTATIGNTTAFLKQFTGRQTEVISDTDDGSPRPEKTILLVRGAGEHTFTRMVELLKSLAQTRIVRFLAFGDSRKMVEQLVARTGHARPEPSTENEVTEPSTPQNSAEPPTTQIMPYRAGYEENDRIAIQKALENGDLAGIVATSALELGLDIGEIDLVILLGTPPTVKAFWQRFGRVGRKKAGICLLLDDRGTILLQPGGLTDYLQRQPEASWLYLENPYLQFTNALCTAVELKSVNAPVHESFATLPDLFLQMLANELNPTQSLPDEFFLLKQRGRTEPHYEFPLRSGIEKNFKVYLRQGPINLNLGSLIYSQVLREAYPGAIYYYLARPYRVKSIKFKTAEILVQREKYYTTQPVTQNQVFPKFEGGIISINRSADGFMAESLLQVHERVIGFHEQHGALTEVQHYDADSPYANRPLARFFETTGVCWLVPEAALMSPLIAHKILEAFGILCGIQSRELGAGSFYYQSSETNSSPIQGACIYDAVHGSLHLTRQLLARFSEILTLAMYLASATDDGAAELVAGLNRLLLFSQAMQPVGVTATVTVEPATDWATVIAPGESGMYLIKTEVTEEVKVKAFQITPQGIMYELDSPDPTLKRMVNAILVRPIFGVTRLKQVHLATGEIRAWPQKES